MSLIFAPAITYNDFFCFAACAKGTFKAAIADVSCNNCVSGGDTRGNGSSTCLCAAGFEGFYPSCSGTQHL